MRNLMIIGIACAALAGCASAQVAKTTPAATSSAAPAQPEPAVVQTGLLAKVVADLQDASARAKAAAAAAKDPNLAKLAADRGACYDTVLVRFNAVAASGSAESPVKGIVSEKEKLLEINDAMSSQGSLIPADIQANCASLAAQETAAVVGFFNKLVGLAGIKGNILLAPGAAAAGAAAAVIKAQ